MDKITVGVLALQGAFYEHIQLLKKAADLLSPSAEWQFIEVRTKPQLDSCDALVLPGGESTAISLIAARSNLLEPLREFVKYASSTTGGSIFSVSKLTACSGYNDDRHGAPAPASFSSLNPRTAQKRADKSLLEGLMSE
jgi:glutamine amidotransferase PdxT